MQEEGLGLKDIETYRDDLQLQFELINHKNPYVEKNSPLKKNLKNWKKWIILKYSGHEKMVGQKNILKILRKDWNKVVKNYLRAEDNVACAGTA